jgi:NAD(P)H-nitrite reductase large subunit
MKLVIIGNGVAGVMTARYVAESDPSIEIALYAEEPYAYYPRPRLIEFLAGAIPLEGMPLYDDKWYEKRASTLGWVAP